MYAKDGLNFDEDNKLTSTSRVLTRARVELLNNSTGPLSNMINVFADRNEDSEITALGTRTKLSW